LNKRFYSLDVFRGATVCLMILVNNPGTWSHIYDPLEHAAWHGLTPTDLVFPFFLFAVGNALSFVMPRLEAGGPALFWRKIITRSLLIFAIGLFLSWWPFFRWSDGELVFRPWVDPVNPRNGVRIMGVLQRIALCYFFASIIIYYFKTRLAFLIGMLLLLAYWTFCYIFGTPGDPYSISGWFGNDIDKAILGEAHMYKGETLNGKSYLFEPEGLASTIPAIVQVILGYIVGDFIRKKGKSYEMLTGLFVSGVAMLIAGYCWDLVFPINKKIWTSSYTIYTTGLAAVTLATMIYMIEMKKIKGAVTSFFDVFGKNALFVFALSAFLPKGLSLIRMYQITGNNGKPITVNPWNFFYQEIFRKIPGPPELGSLLNALFVISVMWFICWWLDRKRIYIKV
jgi:predicted acyltransferase